MPAEPAFVIVGASLAGAKAAETLREHGFEGAVVLIGAEDQYPYERPPLSKGYLLGKDGRDSIFPLADGWYAEHDVDLRLGQTVTSIDRAGHRVTLADGQAVPYDRLLITTGASPRRLNIPGGELDGVRYLRTVGDSEQLAGTLRGGGQVVIAGAAGSAWRPRPPRASTAARSRWWSRSPGCCSARWVPSSARCSRTCTAATA